MATATVYCGTNGGKLTSWNSTTWATILAGGGTVDVATSAGSGYIGDVGPSGSFEADLMYFEFDTGALGASSFSVATLSVYGRSDVHLDTAFNGDVRLYDYSTSLTSADWRTNSQFSALTQLATLDHALMTSGAYVAFTSTGSFPGAISTSDKTRIVIGSSKFAAGTSPADTERWNIYTVGEAGYLAKLDLTYSAAPSIPTLTAVQSGANISVSWT